MRKIIFITVVMILLFGGLVGCAGAPGTTSTVEKTPVNYNITTGGEPPIYRTWASPGKVAIANFYTGATAEYAIIVHNGGQHITDRKSVRTFENEVRGNITLNHPVYGDWRQTTLKSDNKKDKLVIDNYSVAENSISVTGFADNSTRVLDITYQYYADFNVTYRLPDSTAEGYYRPVDVLPTPPNPQKLKDIGATILGSSWVLPTLLPTLPSTKESKEKDAERLNELTILKISLEDFPREMKIKESSGKEYVIKSEGCLDEPESLYLCPELKDWVIIADPTPVMAPQSSQDIMITLTVPEKVSTPDKWEFWISVKDATQSGAVLTELCLRWLIDMRG